MEFILCYTDLDGQDVWESVFGEDAMQIRVGELADEKLLCSVNDIMVFEKSDQWD